MPKNNSKGSSKDGAIRLLLHLQTLYRGSKTITELMDALEDQNIVRSKDRRSVQRDMAVLEGYFGVYRDDNNVWHIDRSDFDKLFDIEDSVALALLVAEKQLAHITPSYILEPLDGLFKRAKAKLKNSDTAAANWSKRVRVAPASHHLKPPKIDNRINKRLINAALNQEAIKVDYYSHQGDPAQQFTVTALSIFYRGSVPYLICRMHSSDKTQNDSLRQLPFSRISDVKETLFDEARVQGFNLAEYEKSGALAFRYGEPFELHLEIFNSVRRELEDSHLGENQRITPIKGHDTVFNMTVTVPYTLNLIQWLLARAPYLKVKAPADFRQKFYKEVARALHHDTTEHVELPKERTF